MAERVAAAAAAAPDRGARHRPLDIATRGPVPARRPSSWWTPPRRSRSHRLVEPAGVQRGGRPGPGGGPDRSGRSAAGWPTWSSTTAVTGSALESEIDRAWAWLRRAEGRRRGAGPALIVTGSRYHRIHARVQVVSDFAPAGDQPTAIAQLSEGVRRGDRFQTLLGITGQRQERHHRLDDRGGAAADAHHRPQQVAGRPAGQRDAGVLPAQPGGVLRQLLRLLPARGLPPVQRHLHREGQLDQRRDRPAPPLGHLGPADPAGHHRGGLGQLHLRPGLARGVRRPDPAPAAGRRAGPAGHPAPAGRHAVRAQRRQPGAGQVPGPGRHHRGPPRLRGARRPDRAVRRRDRAHHAPSTP